MQSKAPHHQTGPARKALVLAALCATLSVSGSASALGMDRAKFKVLGTVIVWGADEAGGTVPVVSNFVIDTGAGNTAATSGDTDLIGDSVYTVVTGSLAATDDGLGGSNGIPLIIQRPLARSNFLTDTNADGVMNAADGFSSFGLRSNTDLNVRRAEIESSFYVASNTAFNIDAQAFPVGATTPAMMNRIQLRLSVTLTGDDGLAFGSAAQYPHTAGPMGGSRANWRRLSTMASPYNVFRGNQKTAAARGTLAEQSVRFDLAYRYNDGPYDLSEGAYDAEAEVIYTVYVP